MVKLICQNYQQDVLTSSSNVYSIPVVLSEAKYLSDFWHSEVISFSCTSWFLAFPPNHIITMYILIITDLVTKFDNWSVFFGRLLDGMLYLQYQYVSYVSDLIIENMQ